MSAFEPGIERTCAHCGEDVTCLVGQCLCGYDLRNNRYLEPLEYDPRSDFGIARAREDELTAAGRKMAKG